MKRNDQALYRDWRNLTGIEALRWRRAAEGLPFGPLDLAYAQSEFAIHLRAHPEPDDSAARSLARYYLQQRAVTVIEAPSLTALYRGVLQRGLHWIDLDAPGAKRMQPAQILQTVCQYRRQSIGNAALDSRLSNYRDVIADEAALIYFHTSPDGRAAADMPMHAIRAQFATALIDQWQDAGIGIALLPSAPIAPVHARFWYDGFSLQNARDKRLQEIAADIFDSAFEAEPTIMQQLIEQASKFGYPPGYPCKGTIDAARREALMRAMHGDLSAIARYEARPGTARLAGVCLTRTETEAIVAGRMRQLMLGMHYPQCSVLDAVETSVRRLAPLHHIGVKAYGHPTELVRAYNLLNRAWRDDPRFAIAPSPYAGQYLTRCRHVLYLTTGGAQTRERQIALQVENLLFPALESALASAPQRLATELDYWRKTIAQFAGTQSSSAIDRAQITSLARPALTPGVRSGVMVRKNAVATLRYANQTDLQRQLHDYMEEELPALSPLPVYDEDFQIEQLLRRKLKMNDHNIGRPRPARLFAPNFLGLPRRPLTGPLTPVEEFKMRRSTSDTVMRHGAESIDTGRELEKVQKQIAAQLSGHPGVHARSKQIMRSHDIPDGAATARSIRQTLANGLVGIPATHSLDVLLGDLDMLFGSPTVAAIVNALASGEPRRILELAPFVVPLYDIEEGIRHRNWDLAKSGALHLGEDLVFTAIGLGAEKILMRQLALDAKAASALRTTPAGTAGAEIEMVQRQPALAAARPEQPFGLGEEPAVQTGLAAQTVPKLPAMELFPDRRAHLTIRLIDEGKSIPVKPIGDAFAETDLRGNILPDAPLVFGDLASRRGYRMLRRPAQLPATGPIQLPDLSTRETVIDVLARWRRLSRSGDIHARRPDPSRIVQSLFSYAHDASIDTLRPFWRRAYARYSNYAQFEAFWTDLYRRSDTAALFLNAAYDSRASRGHAEVSFNAAQARVIGNDVCLLGDKDLADLRYVSLSGATRFQRARMLIHEVLHALAKTSDPAAPTALMHRGETVYFTDLILNESGSTAPAPMRIAYRMPPVFQDNEAAHRLWSRHLLDLHDITAAEDLLLDRTLTADRTYASSTIVLGQKLSERMTVRQSLALAGHMRPFGKFGPRNIEYLFQLTASNFNRSLTRELRAMLKSLLFKSRMLRELAHAWVNRFFYSRLEIKSVDFLLRDGYSLSHAVAHIISGNTLWLNTEKLYYFSERGLMPLHEKRRFVGCILEFFLNELMPSMPRLPIHRWIEHRGVHVLLENEILAQTGDSSAPRICAALTTDPHSYMKHLTTIRRAADTEDGYLRQTLRAMSPLTQDAAIDDDLLGLAEAARPASR